MMNRKFNKFFYALVHVLEYFIAIMTIVVLIGLLGYEIYKMTLRMPIKKNALVLIAVDIGGKNTQE